MHIKIQHTHTRTNRVAHQVHFSHVKCSAIAIAVRCSIVRMKTSRPLEHSHLSSYQLNRCTQHTLPRLTEIHTTHARTHARKAPAVSSYRATLERRLACVARAFCQRLHAHPLTERHIRNNAKVPCIIGIHPSLQAHTLR